MTERLPMNWRSPAALRLGSRSTRMSLGELERQMSGAGSARDRTADNPEIDSAPGSRASGRRTRRPRRCSGPTGPVVPYAELHCHSNFSFLDGASDPEELIEEAVRLGLDALAITDHDGFYAASRFAEAALAYDLRDDLRRRAVPGPDRAAERRRRSGGPAPAGAGPRCRGLPPAGGGDHRGPAARRREGPTALRPGGAGRAGGRALVDPDRLPQGRGPSGPGRRGTGRGRGRTGRADRAVRSTTGSWSS